MGPWEAYPLLDTTSMSGDPKRADYCLLDGEFNFPFFLWEDVGLTGPDAETFIFRDLLQSKDQINQLSNISQIQ